MISGTRWAAMSLGLLLLAGCDSSDAPQQQTPPDVPNVGDSQKDETPQESAQPASPIHPDSAGWMREEALANLEEPDLGLSAAVRLVRLAGMESEMLPDPLADDAARKLRFLPLSDSLYALGVRDAENDRILQTPLLIDVEGNVTQPAGNGERLTLHISPEPSIFPHLLIGPHSAADAARAAETRIEIKSPKSARFEIRQQNGVDYLALMHSGDEQTEPEEDANEDNGDPEAEAEGVEPSDTPAGDDSAQKPDHSADGAIDPPEASAPSASTIEPVEIARYEWDPFERMFTGPARDKFPEPLKGRFVLDLETSKWLVPVGGEIGEADPIKSDAVDDEDEWD